MGMASYKIAHLREQGVDLIIVPLDNSLGLKSSSEQHQTINLLQACAQSVGLAGTIVPVWQSALAINLSLHLIGMDSSTACFGTKLCITSTKN
jgi:hypothetical protein